MFSHQELTQNTAVAPAVGLLPIKIEEILFSSINKSYIRSDSRLGAKKLHLHHSWLQFC